MNSFYVTIVGAQQGQFRKESTNPKHRPAIMGLRFSMETATPFDAATGKLSAKHQHQPITFSKAWGAASPQILRALVTNEVLTSVLFEFVRTDPSAIEDVFQTITLESAQVVDFKRSIDPHSPAASGGGQFLEDVTLTYGKIMLEDMGAKTTVFDDWAV